MLPLLWPLGLLLGALDLSNCHTVFGFSKMAVEMLAFVRCTRWHPEAVDGGRWAGRDASADAARALQRAFVRASALCRGAAGCLTRRCASRSATLALGPVPLPVPSASPLNLPPTLSLSLAVDGSALFSKGFPFFFEIARRPLTFAVSACEQLRLCYRLTGGWRVQSSLLVGALARAALLVFSSRRPLLLRFRVHSLAP